MTDPLQLPGKILWWNGREGRLLSEEDAIVFISPCRCCGETERVVFNLQDKALAVKRECVAHGNRMSEECPYRTLCEDTKERPKYPDCMLGAHENNEVKQIVLTRCATRRERLKKKSKAKK